MKTIPAAEWNFSNEDITRSVGKYKIEAKLCNVTTSNESLCGCAAAFDPASGGYIDLGFELYDILEGKEGFTVAMWVQNKQITYNSFVRLFSMYTSCEQAMTLNVYPGIFDSDIRSCPEDEASYIKRAKGLAANPEFQSYSGNANRWYHIALIADFKNKKAVMFINGEQAAINEECVFSSDIFKAEHPKYPVTVGGDPTVSRTFCGLIDSIRIYDRALDSDEIACLKDEYKDTRSAMEKDGELIERVKAVLENGMSFHEGSSTVLKNGRINKLDVTDYSVKTVKKDGKIYIPACYLKVYENMPVSDEKGVISAEELAKLLDMKLIYDGENHVLITPHDTRPDEAVLERMKKFHTNPYPFKEPERPHEQSRCVVAYLPPKQTKVTAQDPAVVRVDENTILVKGIFGDNPLGLPTGNAIFRSDDNGNSFKAVADVGGPGRSRLVKIGNDIYLIGELYNETGLSIVKSIDGGITWSEPKAILEGVLPQGSHSHGASFGTATIANGRIYVSFEVSVWSYPQTMKTYTMSAPVNSDLMCEENWTISNFLETNPDTIKEQGIVAHDPCWLESSVVPLADGNVASVVRMNTRPSSNHAAIRYISADGTKMTFNPKNDIIKMPGGHTGFNVQYDEKSGYYVSLVNTQVAENHWFCEARNVLQLVISKDLKEWTVVETVLADRELVNYEASMHFHGFQYVDWKFDGENLIIAVREAAEDSRSYHQGNYLTFYTVKDFRKNFNKTF